MSDRISREEFETTQRDRGLFEAEASVDIFRRYGVYEFRQGQRVRVDIADCLSDLKDGLVSFLCSRTNPMALDVGGGEGKTMLELSRLVPALNGAVVDLYPPDSKQIKELSHERIHYVRADLDQGLPIKDQAADLIIARKVLLYLDDPLKFINLLIRATKPGGLVLLDGTKNLVLDATHDRGSSIFFHVDNQNNTVRFFDNFNDPDSNMVIRVNDPSYQINGFELEPNLQRDKKMKFWAATQGMGVAFWYKRS